MLAAFQQAVDAAFAAYGEPAVYRSNNDGQRGRVIVIPRRPDQQIDNFTETAVHTQTTTFDVRAADIPTPEAGDTVEFGGTLYIVRSEPRRDDPRRLVWTLDTRPA